MSKQERLTIKGTIGFLRRLGPRVGPYTTPLVLAGVLMLCSVGIGLAFPLVVRELLDAAFLAEDSAVLNRIAIGLLLLFAVLAVINFSQSYLTASVSEKVVADLRRDIFGALVYQPPGFFANRRVGELSSRLASDSGLIQGVLRFGVPEIIRQVTFLMGALVLVTITNPRLTLVTLTAIPFAALVGWFFGRRVRRLSTNIQDRLADAVARAEQVFTQIRTVQSFTRESYENEAYVGAVNRARDEGLRRALARASLTGAVTFAAFGAIVGVLWVGGRLVLDGALSPGTLVAFLLYAVTISGAITSLAGFWANLQEAAGAARRIFEILDHPVAIESPTAPRRLPTPVRGVVRYEGVTFRYEPHLPRVLDGIDLVLDEGVTVALVGISGSGKSTLLHILGTLDRPSEGELEINAEDVLSLDGDSLAQFRNRHIGFVFQFHNLLPEFTALENVMLPGMIGPGPVAEVRDKAMELLASVGLEERFDHRPGELSGGECQRVAVVRALAMNPLVVFADEPSGNLDAAASNALHEMIVELSRSEKQTFMVMTHDQNLAQSLDRTGHIEAGVLHLS